MVYFLYKSGIRNDHPNVMSVPFLLQSTVDLKILQPFGIVWLLMHILSFCPSLIRIQNIDAGKVSSQCQNLRSLLSDITNKHQASRIT
eukprot:jgi/Botrbrau1/16201/Bobra.160_1s0002.1